MNYGLALMAQGDYTNAEISFNNALEYVPYYSSIYTNMGILKNAIGDKESADKYFQKSLSLNDANHKTKYFYGRYLFQNNKFKEAIDQFKEVDQSVPNYLDTNDYIFKSYHKLKDWENMKSFGNEVLANWPKDVTSKKYLDIALNKKSILTVLEEEVSNGPSPEKYLNLSLQYFNEGNYEDCIRVAGKALELNPEYADAYNNIGIGHFYLLNYDQAIEAYQKALELNPSYQLAKNNLANAKDKKNDLANATSNLSDKEASDYYINLSLEFYKKEKYQSCIAAARKSNAIKPNAIAYNNICSSYNQLKEYQKAIAACNEALKLDASSKLASGNLNYAEQQSKNR